MTVSNNTMGIYLPNEIWTIDWPANTKLVFGYLWKRQGQNGCAWPFQGTMVAELKQPNRRTIQTSIASLEASGHLRRLKTSSRSRVAYQLRLSVTDAWPIIPVDAAKKAQILPDQHCTICAASNAKSAQPSSLKFTRKNTQGRPSTREMDYVDNIDDLFGDDDDAPKAGTGTVLSVRSSGHATTSRVKNRGPQ